MRQWFLHPLAFVLLLAAALGVRLAAAAYFEARLPDGVRFEFGDSDSYWYLAQQLAAGEPYQLRSPDAQVFRMPGYPAVLAPIFWIAGPNAPSMAGRVLGAVLGTWAVALVTWWGSLLFGKPTGLVAGAITAFYPGAIATSAFVLSEAPFCPLLVLQIIWLTYAYQADKASGVVAYSTLSGIAAAGAIYMRPSWLLFLPFAVGCGLLFDKQRLRISNIFCLASLALAVCLLPWWVRNYRATGHFVATTLQVGISLKDGLNPWADGASDLARAEQFHLEAADPVDESEWAANGRHLQEAISWAMANPKRVFDLAMTKFLRMWNPFPNEPMFRSWWMKWGVAIAYLPVLLLGLAGVWHFAKAGFPYWLCVLPAVYFTLLHVVFVSSIRYREPAMFGLIVLASGMLSRGKATPCTA